MSHSIPEAISITSGKIPMGHPRFDGKMNLKGLPLDGDSELLRAMDNRMMFMGHIALIQVMQPHTGAGVKDHSDVYDNTLSRLAGSIQMITASAFDGENGSKISQFITAAHKPIHGKDHRGTLYSALNPKSWADTHLTFFHAAEQSFLRFDPRADDSDHPEWRDEIPEQMYMEYITWYQRFGITDKYLPENYGEYLEYWQNMIENDLVMTDAAKWGFGMLKHNQFPFPKALPALARKALNIPLGAPTGMVGKLIMGGMPPEILSNKIFKKDMPSYGKLDQLMIRGFDESIKRAWPHLPASARYPASDLGFLQQHGLHDGVTDRLAVTGWNTAKSALSVQSSLARSAKSLLRLA
jgi:uncharacterized protein (DUF2236 family)